MDGILRYVANIRAGPVISRNYNANSDFEFLLILRLKSNYHLKYHLQLQEVITNRYTSHTREELKIVHEELGHVDVTNGAQSNQFFVHIRVLALKVARGADDRFHGTHTYGERKILNLL